MYHYNNYYNNEINDFNNIINYDNIIKSAIQQQEYNRKRKQQEYQRRLDFFVALQRKAMTHRNRFAKYGKNIINSLNEPIYYFAKKQNENEINTFGSYENNFFNNRQKNNFYENIYQKRLNNKRCPVENRINNNKKNLNGYYDRI